MEIQTEGSTTAGTRQPNGQLGSAAAKTAPTGRNTAPCRRTCRQVRIGCNSGPLTLTTRPAYLDIIWYVTTPVMHPYTPLARTARKLVPPDGIAMTAAPTAPNARPYPHAYPGPSGLTFNSGSPRSALQRA